MHLQTKTARQETERKKPETCLDMMFSNSLTLMIQMLKFKSTQNVSHRATHCNKFPQQIKLVSFYLNLCRDKTINENQFSVCTLNFYSNHTSLDCDKGKGIGKRQHEDALIAFRSRAYLEDPLPLFQFVCQTNFDEYNQFCCCNRVVVVLARRKWYKREQKRFTDKMKEITHALINKGPLFKQKFVNVCSRATDGTVHSI